MLSNCGVAIIQSKNVRFHFRLCQNEMSLASPCCGTSCINVNHSTILHRSHMHILKLLPLGALTQKKRHTTSNISLNLEHFRYFTVPQKHYM